MPWKSFPHFLRTHIRFQIDQLDQLSPCPLLHKPSGMPRIRTAVRSTRVPKNIGTAPLRRYVKPRNMDRLLAALYEAFQERGTKWIPVETLLSKIEEQAQTLDDTLGKKFGPYCRSCLSALRRNSYVEYKIFDCSDDEVRITDCTKEIFENLKNAILTFGDQSVGDLYRLKCDYLRKEIQPKSRRLPTRAELDRENIELGQKNRELMEEHAELESELNLLKQDLTTLPLQQSVQILQREETEPNIEHLESGFTDSMYTDPVHASQEQISLQRRPSIQMPVLVTQPLSRQIHMQTPVRPSTASPSAAACYPTPESAPRNSLGRQDSHLLSPPASPGSRWSSPDFPMPGALAVESFGGENGGEGERQENGGNMDIDDDEQTLTRPCTPEPARVDGRAFLTSGFAPIQTKLISTDCAWCAIHQDQVDPTRVISPAMAACEGCESKTKTIESNEKVISELQGNLQDHKSLIDNLQDLILQKIRKIRELTSSP